MPTGSAHVARGSPPGIQSVLFGLSSYDRPIVTTVYRTRPGGGTEDLTTSRGDARRAQTERRSRGCREVSRRWPAGDRCRPVAWARFRFDLRTKNCFLMLSNMISISASVIRSRDPRADLRLISNHFYVRSHAHAESIIQHARHSSTVAFVERVVDVTGFLIVVLHGSGHSRPSLRPAGSPCGLRLLLCAQSRRFRSAAPSSSHSLALPSSSSSCVLLAQSAVATAHTSYSPQMQSEASPGSQPSVDSSMQARPALERVRPLSV
jgi:hypothetical protein